MAEPANYSAQSHVRRPSDRLTRPYIPSPHEPHFVGSPPAGTVPATTTVTFSRPSAPRTRGDGPPFHLCQIRVLRRDRVFAELRSRNIAVGVHYPPNHLQPAFAAWRRSLPATEQAGAQILSLPFHQHLTETDIGQEITLDMLHWADTVLAMDAKRPRNAPGDPWRAEGPQTRPLPRRPRHPRLWTFTYFGSVGDLVMS
ncbi:DegT/DnrJ/EryC1/StrS family aminotransferase [Streptomyces sp. NPDC021080]|uniref:DegT/DnrJ/EryC1/StrS family aminotransferase n=1 Tax=Streptomyces sp. NPDC021080 TaxID=3365110 RepID=UPI0037AC1CB5